MCWLLYVKKKIYDPHRTRIESARSPWMLHNMLNHAMVTQCLHKVTLCCYTTCHKVTHPLRNRFRVTQATSNQNRTSNGHPGCYTTCQMSRSGHAWSRSSVTQHVIRSRRGRVTIFRYTSHIEPKSNQLAHCSSTHCVTAIAYPPRLAQKLSGVLLRNAASGTHVAKGLHILRDGSLVE